MSAVCAHLAPCSLLNAGCASRGPRAPACTHVTHPGILKLSLRDCNATFACMLPLPIEQALLELPLPIKPALVKAQAQRPGDDVFEEVRPGCHRRFPKQLPQHV